MPSTDKQHTFSKAYSHPCHQSFALFIFLVDDDHIQLQQGTGKGECWHSRQIISEGLNHLKSHGINTIHSFNWNCIWHAHQTVEI